MLRNVNITLAAIAVLLLLFIAGFKAIHRWGPQFPDNPIVQLLGGDE